MPCWNWPMAINASPFPILESSIPKHLREEESRFPSSLPRELSPIITISPLLISPPNHDLSVGCGIYQICP